MQQILQTKELCDNEINGKVISETSTFRLLEVTYKSGWEETSMLRLEVKINDEYVSFMRYEKGKSWEMDHLRRHIEHIDIKRGWFSVYGKRDEYTGEEYANGSPQEQMDLAKEYPFRNITSIDKIGKGIWKFRGNHENYSSSFQYIIWDKKIAQMIKKELPKLTFVRSSK